MKAELKARILAYNKSLAERTEKAKDLEVILDEIKKLPPGQLKKLMTPEIIAILEKYGLLSGE